MAGKTQGNTEPGRARQAGAAEGRDAEGNGSGRDRGTRCRLGTEAQRLTGPGREPKLSRGIRGSEWSCRRIGLVCYQVLGVFSQSEAVPGSLLLVLSRRLPKAEVRPSFPAGRNYHPTSLTRKNEGN